MGKQLRSGWRNSVVLICVGAILLTAPTTVAAASTASQGVVNGASNDVIDVATETTADVSAETTSEITTEIPVETTSEPTADAPAEPTSDLSTETTAEIPVETTMETTAETTTVETVESSPMDPTEPSVPVSSYASLSGVEGFVTRCYQITLGRDPDAVGFSHWVDGLTSHSLTAIEAAFGFLFSPEYTNKNLGNEAYVENLYQLMLGRNADPTGRDNWVGQLNRGADRTAIFAGFANSVEFHGICDGYQVTQGYYMPGYSVAQSSKITGFVIRLYTVCLGRGGDNTGVSDWTRQLMTGSQTGAGVAYGFFFSNEFLGKHLSASDYVTTLYRTFLNRDPDPTGYGCWTAAIQSGSSMESVFAGFVNSAEFSAICGTYGISRGTYTVPENPHQLIEINAENVTLYALDSKYSQNLSIPTDYASSFPLKVTGYSGAITYRVISGSTVTVDTKGVIRPRSVTWYRIDYPDGTSKSSTKSFGDPNETVETIHNFGETKIEVTAGNTKIVVTVTLENFVRAKAENRILQFINQKITTGMDNYGKVDAIARFATSFPVSDAWDTLEEMLATGMGTIKTRYLLFTNICARVGVPTRPIQDLTSKEYTQLVRLENATFAYSLGNKDTTLGYYDFRRVADFETTSDGKGGLTLVRYNGFSENLTVPGTIDGKPVTGIGKYAFTQNTLLLSVVLPESVTAIDEFAFLGCVQLNTATLSSKTTRIGMGAFGLCVLLRTINLPEGLLEIGDSAFFFCASLKNVQIPDSVTIIGKSAFSTCMGITELKLPKNLTTLGDSAFSGCLSLIKVAIPSKLTVLPTSVFGGCLGLTKVLIPATVTSIADNAFPQSSNLTIYGSAGSAADAYASKRGLAFVIG